MLGLGLGLNRCNYTGGFHPLTIAHIARVAQQGGTIDSSVLLNLYVLYLVNNGLMSSQYIGAIPSVTGYKESATVAGNCQIVFSVDPAGSTSGSYIGDMVQNTTVNQPILLKYNGEKYYWGSGVEGNYCISNTTNAITDDIEIILKKYNFNTLLNQECLFSNNSNIVLFKGVDGKLEFYLNNGAIVDITSSTVIPYSANTDFYIKCNRKRSTGIANIFLSLDGINWGNGVVYDGTPFATGTGTTSAIITGSYYQIGSYFASICLSGKLQGLTISPTIGGTPTVNFDFTNYNPAVSETTWTSSTRETWTLNRPVTYIAKSYSKSTIVTRTNIQTNVFQYLDSGLFVNSDFVSIFMLDTYLDTPKADYYRGAFSNNSPDSPIGGGYLNMQPTYEPIFQSGLYGFYSNYTFAGIPFPDSNKKYLLTITAKEYNTVSKFQKNKDTIAIGVSGSYTTPFRRLRTTQPNYGGVNRELNAMIVLKGDNQSNDAFKDFLNTIFNGEIY